jgi:hypothetical protein
MKIQTFNDGTGIIYGDSPSILTCEISGVLNIGGTEFTIDSERETHIPQLFNAASGNFKAEYITEKKTYTLRKIKVKRGFIEPPSDDVVEMTYLKARVDEVDRKCEKVLAEVARLDKLFDTNSLNFLIK